MASDAQAVCAGFRHSMILKQDGSVWSAGCGYYGQLGDGKKDERTRFVQVVILVLSVLNSHNLLG